MSANKRTLLDKLWDSHQVLAETKSTPGILYIDLHLIHEVTSPQAFDELRMRGLPVRRPDRVLATLDHSTPTTPTDDLGQHLYANAEAAARLQQRAQRHRPCDRPGARRDSAGHDHRLRRQPHDHARRLWRAGLRHRHD